MPAEKAPGRAAKKPPRPNPTAVSVEDLCMDAEAILQGDHHRRLRVGQNRMLARLAEAVNGIADLLGSKEHLLGENIQSLQRVNRELRETQEDSLRNEKLVALGRVAAGIAHEIGNPIGAILGYIDLLKSGPALDGEVTDSLTRMEAAAWRINGIIRELLDFARPSPGLLDSLDVNAIVVEMLEELGKQPAFAQVTLRRELDRGSPRITANSHRVRQLLVNLLTNAADASDGRGTIVVATRSFESVHEPPPASPLSPRRKNDPPEVDYSHLRPVLSYDPTADRPLNAETSWVEIRIADSGQGIAPEALREVFDPFFTTKPPGKGTGLGLPLSLSIVRSLRGRMQITSAVGAGTTVTVQVPAAPPSTGG
jgi:signal transduction histidine kinase